MAFADVAEGTQLGDGKGSSGIGEGAGNAVIMRRRGGDAGRGVVADGQGERITVGGQSERDGVRSWGGAMLDGEGEIIAVAAQIEVAVAPSVKLRRTAESLAATESVGALLGVVDDDDGELMLSLEVAQKASKGATSADEFSSMWCVPRAPPAVPRRARRRRCCEHRAARGAPSHAPSGTGPPSNRTAPASTQGGSRRAPPGCRGVAAQLQLGRA